MLTSIMDSKKLINRVIKLSFATAIFSRGGGFFLQIFSLPLAAQALGVKEFGIYSILNALLSWMYLCSIGIPQSTTYHISRSNVTSMKRLFFGASLLLMLIILTSILLIMYLVYYNFGDYLFSFYLMEKSNVFLCFISMVIIFLLNQFFSIFEAVQNGMLKNYKYNLFLGFGSFAAAFILFLVSRNNITIEALLWVINGPLFIARAINAYCLIHEISPLFLGLRKKHFSLLINDSWGFFKGGSLNNFFSYSFLVIAVGYFGGAYASANFSIVVNFILIGVSVFNYFLNPLKAIIPSQMTEKNNNWIRLFYIKTIFFLSIMGFVFLLVMHFWGSNIFNIWYSGLIVPGKLLIMGASLYLLVCLFEIVSYCFLSGIGFIRLASNITLIKSLCVSLISVFIVYYYNYEYILLVSFFIGFLFSCLPLGWIFLKKIEVR